MVVTTNKIRLRMHMMSSRYEWINYWAERRNPYGDWYSLKLLKPVYVMQEALVVVIRPTGKIASNEVTIPKGYLTDYASSPVRWFREYEPSILPSIFHDYASGTRCLGKDREGFDKLGKAYYTMIRNEEKCIGKKVSLAWIYFLFTHLNPIFKAWYLKG